MSFCFVFDISVWIISFSMLFLPLWLICHMQANVWIKFVRSLFMLFLGIVLSIFPILLYWVTGFEDSCFWFLFVFSDNSSSYCNNKYLILFTLHHLHFLDCIDDIPTEHWPSYCVNYGLEYYFIYSRLKSLNSSTSTSVSLYMLYSTTANIA